jgi:hypothetical protein
LEPLKSWPEFYEEKRGFIVALEDCITTYRRDWRIPEIELPWEDSLPAENQTALIT